MLSDTRSGLIAQPLRWHEWLILGAYASLVTWPAVPVRLLAKSSTLTSGAQEAMGLFLAGFTVGLAMLTFSPGTRYRNIYFSVAWLGLSIWLMIKSHGTAIEPVALLLLYHAVRGHFWWNHQREFVPASVGRNKYYREYYQLEKRHGSLEDTRYTTFWFRVGMVVLFASWLLPLHFVSDPTCTPPCLYRPTSKP